MTTLAKHPVELLSGLLLAILGVMMTVAGTEGNTYRLYAGGIATAMGGVLLSWTVGKSVSKREAMEDIRSQLGLVSKTLGQAAGQINRVVDQCIDSSMPSEAGFMMVGQQALLVGAQVSAIQEILGESFETATLLSTLTEVEKLAARLDRKDRQGADTTGELEEVRRRLRDMLADVAGTSGQSVRMTEPLTCPHCDASLDASLGAQPGSTAMVHCSSCSRRFNVHRRSDGSIFTPAAGKKVIQPRYLTANCLSCNEEISVAERQGGFPQAAVCTRCGAQVLFHGHKLPITLEGKYEKVSGKIVGTNKKGSRPLVYCDDCAMQYSGLIDRDRAFYAIDHRCKRLFEISYESLWEWRREAREPLL